MHPNNSTTKMLVWTVMWFQNGWWFVGELIFLLLLSFYLLLKSGENSFQSFEFSSVPGLKLSQDFVQQKWISQINPQRI